MTSQKLYRPSSLWLLVKNEFNKPCIVVLAVLQITVCLCLYELYNHKLIFVNIDPFEYTINAHKHFYEHRKLHLDWGHLRYLSPQNSYIAWDEIKQRDPPPVESMHDKWIVVATSVRPTQAIKKLAAVKEWKVVVVGNINTPHDWSLNNCIFLDVERQKSLEYHITKLLPVDHYSRKSVGYLFAIHHGARFIYDVDNNVLLNSQHTNLSFHLEPSESFFMFDTTALVVNPCANFGQENQWLRGFPLEVVNEDPPDILIPCKIALPSVQQALINGVSDLDAVFYLTRKEYKSFVEFKSNSKHVRLPNGTFAPSSSQNTLFHYNALWGMLLPVSMTASVGDIWRGYITQRLLWEVGQTFAVLPPNSFKQRVPRNLSDHLKLETPLYHKSLDLLKFLKHWQSGKTAFFDVTLDLYIALAKSKMLDVQDAQLMEAWLYDLVSVGYLAPNITTRGSWVC